MVWGKRYASLRDCVEKQLPLVADREREGGVVAFGEVWKRLHERNINDDDAITTIVPR